MKPGESFEEAEVARAYLHRPDYADGIYQKLLEISQNHGSLLDLGCGTGKIARRLCTHFQAVTAIDRSMEMLSAAATQQTPADRNVTWVHGPAEEAPLEGAPFDLVVAGASIHWMDHAAIFPRLRASVDTGHVFAAVDGDGAFDPPWQAEWDEFLRYWIGELRGEAYEPGRPDSAFATRMNSYRNWLNVSGEMTALSEPIRQRVEDFVTCQHSRDTFAPCRLGTRLREFDEQLSALLRPHATEGVLTYTVQSKVVWGSIPREA